MGPGADQYNEQRLAQREMSSPAENQFASNPALETLGTTRSGARVTAEPAAVHIKNLVV